jgi:hypothetical protein
VFVQFGGSTKQHPVVWPKFSEGGCMEQVLHGESGTQIYFQGERSLQ